MHSPWHAWSVINIPIPEGSSMTQGVKQQNKTLHCISTLVCSTFLTLRSHFISASFLYQNGYQRITIQLRFVRLQSYKQCYERTVVQLWLSRNDSQVASGYFYLPFTENIKLLDYFTTFGSYFEALKILPEIRLALKMRYQTAEWHFIMGSGLSFQYGEYWFILYILVYLILKDFARGYPMKE